MQMIVQIIFVTVLSVLALFVGTYVIHFCLQGIKKVYYYFIYIPVSQLFLFANQLQRWLSKPWRCFLQNNYKSEGAKVFWRGLLELVKIPLYVVLTPLRFANAAFFNIFGYAAFEIFNYLEEFVMPSTKKKGIKGFFLWVVKSPWLLIQYLVWHPMLTIIESFLWTGIDTVIPALTLYHGTDLNSAESIVSSPGRVTTGTRLTGTWHVGGGNFAGDGIYFAPRQSTAEHYSRNDIVIVCRVSLGKVLDMGLAPRSIYNCCGTSSSSEVTKYGLSHKYTTGEWWRTTGDKRWWEYCMFDRGNRYNYSWRIRPMYLLNIKGGTLQRVSGGMTHWFFRKMVIKDILNSL